MTTALVAVPISNSAQGDNLRHIVRQKIIRPAKQITRHEHFTPDAHPSPSEVLAISAREQAKWGGPSIDNRMRCESGLRWYATNGQYQGLLQIGPWWSYAYAQTPRGVTLRDAHHRHRWVRRIRWFANGRHHTHRLHRMRQRVKVVRHGRLASDASPYSGWAAIRVGQRAVSGDGPSTAWSCSL